MKHLYIFVLLICFANIKAKAQTEPPPPAGCRSNGESEDNYLIVTGNTNFTLNNLSDFGTSQSFNNITVRVKSETAYTLYIAGEMTSKSSSSTNTIIPLNIFTISATNHGSAPVLIPLTNTYLAVARNSATGNGATSHVLTITRGAMKSLMPEPGVHTLYLHIRLCN